MLQVNVNLLIALIGAITGIISLSIQFFKYLNEKPKLKLIANISRERGIFRLLLIVTNVGPRSTTIQRARIIKEKDKDYFKTKSNKKKYKMFSLKPVRLILIEPGNSVEYSLVISYKHQKDYLMSPQIPFVIDSLGKITKGKSFNFAKFIGRYNKNKT